MMTVHKTISILVVLSVLAAVVLGSACSGSRGEQGASGVGIRDIVANGDGTFTIEFTDDSTYVTPNLTGPQGPAGPTAPVIQSLDVAGLPASPGDDVTATVVAQSASGLALTYSWTVSPGWTIQSGSASSQAIIAAPSAYGASGAATVTVTDSSNRAATGTISLCTERNYAPIINSLWTSGNPVRKGLTLDVYASATDLNGDSIIYEWSTPPGWTIQSGQGTAHARVQAPAKLLAAGFASLIVSDESGGSASASIGIGTLDGDWGSATLIETDDTEHAASPQVAVDSSGNAIAVWKQSDGIRDNIWANRFVSGIGWGAAIPIESNDNTADSPQVAVDPSGNAMAVWQQADNLSVLTSIWASRFVPGVGWGAAGLIETDESGNALSPQVALDSNGNAVAVWYQWDGIRNNIWANRFVPGTGWGTATLIETDDTGSASLPQVAVDPGGNAVAVWYQSDGTRENIWANRFVPGTGWGTATLIETDDTGGAKLPQVAVDPSGNAVAVWYQSDGTRDNIWANRFASGVGWGAATLIEANDTGDARVPQVAVDPSGNAVAVWRQSDGIRDNIWANRFVPGMGWGTAILIETDNRGSANLPQVAVDPSGNAVAVWQQSDGTLINICGGRFVSGVGWCTAGLIETNDSWSAFNPQVAVDPSGNVVAVWQQLAGTRDSIWTNLLR